MSAANMIYGREERIEIKRKKINYRNKKESRPKGL